MSQRDLVAELRGARIAAPAEVREHVRLIVAGAPAPPRRFTWRRTLVIAVPAVAAVAAAVLITRPSSDQTATPPAPVELQAQSTTARAPSRPTARVTADRDAAMRSPPLPPPAASALRRVPLAARRHANGVSNGVKRALQIATSLGGYSTSVHASTRRQGGDRRSDAEGAARARPGGDRSPVRARHDHRRAGRRPGPDDPAERRRPDDRAPAEAARRAPRRAADRQHLAPTIAALTAHIERLQRQQAATERAAHYATVQLHLETPPAAQPAHHGTARCTVSASRSAGSGSAPSTRSRSARRSLLLVGLAWFAARMIRRRRVDALLSRP